MIIFIIKQLINIKNELNWLNNVFKLSSGSKLSVRSPKLLKYLDNYLKERSGKFIFSQSSMKTVMESLEGRLIESREISRYLIGLLIFLGLLGTFWGLIGTVGSVSNVISGLNFGNQDTSLIFSSLQEGLETPLEGMSTAFSSSLFGLAGSLILGFLDLQLGQASGRFYQDLENWLSSSVKISNNNNQNPLADNISYSDSLSEGAAQHLSELASALTNIEADRSRLLNQITELNTQLRRLADQIENDNSIQKKLPVLTDNLFNTYFKLNYKYYQLNKYKWYFKNLITLSKYLVRILLLCPLQITFLLPLVITAPNLKLHGDLIASL